MIQSLSRLLRRQQPRVHADDVRTLEQLANTLERHARDARHLVAGGYVGCEDDVRRCDERCTALRRVIRAVTE